MIALMKKESPKTIVDEVIKRLTEKRKSLNLSHEKVAELAGLHRSTISLIESRKREPTLQTVIKIAHALDYDLAKLIIINRQK